MTKSFQTRPQVLNDNNTGKTKGWMRYL